ncbi:hypothetical protein [Arenimonas composti]|uniref:Lipocalin-like domain-containing protein n=1 Tax=Arenimonas composti TR7-09 = DSM 18010 TaxID=1121013 RepID=A0A091BZY5_9GAMM|nr:hypothetical protein [Arenimonas composti]KFN49905.1 hypothetical protein P873_08665 [Arenimonas composti TR7-09 = DSM 18010]
MKRQLFLFLAIIAALASPACPASGGQTGEGPSPAARPEAPANPLVGSWQEAMSGNGTTLEVRADGSALLTVPGYGGGTYAMRYVWNGSEAELTGYPDATASMRISETGSLFINYENTTTNSRGMMMFRRASP